MSCAVIDPMPIYIQFLVNERYFGGTEGTSAIQMSFSTTTRGRRAECELQPVVGGRGTLNSASAALFSSATSKNAKPRVRTLLHVLQLRLV